jgi:IQ calmodulin-binding motif
VPQARKILRRIA